MLKLLSLSFMFKNKIYFLEEYSLMCKEQQTVDAVLENVISVAIRK